MKTRKHDDYKKSDARRSDEAEAEADSITAGDKPTEYLSKNEAAQHCVSNKNKTLESWNPETLLGNANNTQFSISSSESYSDQMCRTICKSLFKSIKERHYSLSSSFISKYEATAYDADEEFDLSELDSETFQQKIEALSPRLGHIMDSPAAQPSVEELEKYEVLYEIVMKKQNLDPSEIDLCHSDESVCSSDNNNQKDKEVLASTVEHEPISLGKLPLKNEVLNTKRSPETLLQKRLTMSTKTDRRNIQDINHSSTCIKKDNLSPKSYRSATRSDNNRSTCHRSKRATAQRKEKICQKVSREFEDLLPNDESDNVFSNHDLKLFYSWTCKRLKTCTTISPKKRVKGAPGDYLTRELRHSARKTPTSIESRQSPQKMQPKSSGSILPFRFGISKAPWSTNRNYSVGQTFS